MINPSAFLKQAGVWCWARVLVLAGYGLFPLEYRFSRGIVLFSGMTGTVVILLVRWLLSLLHWIKLVPRVRVDYKAAIIGNMEDYASPLLMYSNIRITTSKSLAGSHRGRNRSNGYWALRPTFHRYNNCTVLTNWSLTAAPKVIKRLWSRWNAARPILFTRYMYRVAKSCWAATTRGTMPKNFRWRKKYRIGTADAKRNKRITDIFAAGLFLIFYPLWMLKVNNRKGFFKHIVQVLQGNKTWVGYAPAIAEVAQLPESKTRDNPALRTDRGGVCTRSVQRRAISGAISLWIMPPWMTSGLSGLTSLFWAMIFLIFRQKIPLFFGNLKLIFTFALPSTKGLQYSSLAQLVRASDC